VNEKLLRSTGFVALTTRPLQPSKSEPVLWSNHLS
jgi:hypothetical protein